MLYIMNSISKLTNNRLEVKVSTATQTAWLKTTKMFHL